MININFLKGTQKHVHGEELRTAISDQLAKRARKYLSQGLKKTVDWGSIWVNAEQK